MIDLFFNDMNMGDFLENAIWDNKIFNINYPMDIYITDDVLHIDVAIVAGNKEDVDLEVHDNVLEINYKGSNEKFDDDTKVYVHNIAKRGCAYKFQIMPQFNLNKLKAKAEKGLLRITIPSAKKSKKQKITID